MLTRREIKEIRNLLENANNPLYLFDDDGDGLCAYLMLKKFYKKGTGKPIKNAGPLNKEDIESIEDEKPDLIIILDKAKVKQEFIDNSHCPVLWIDHHPIQERQRAFYYNPLVHDKKSYYPTSYLTYQITKEDLWLSVIGCLFDYMIPEYIKEFIKKYPKLLKRSHKDPGYLMFKAEIGKLVKLFAFNIKGKKSDVKKSLKALEKIKSPNEIIYGTTEEGKFLKERFKKLNKEYEKLLNQAKENVTKDKIILFEYPHMRTSFTRDLATELSYFYQNKIIVISRESNGYMKMSLRYQKGNIAKPLAKTLEIVKGHGGGHEHACGATIKRKDFNDFIENIKKHSK